MENYSRYTEKIQSVALYKATDVIECIVTTFYKDRAHNQYAISILTQPVELSVGDSVTVKNSGHRGKISKVVEFSEEYGYKLTATTYHIEPPDPKTGPWYFRRNLF
jgi:hypothetical protein